MSNAKMATEMFKSTPHIALLSFSLFWTYFSLGWRVHRARVAFEKQLTAQGMSKEDARQLSQFLADLKEDLTATLKQGITGRGFG